MQRLLFALCFEESLKCVKECDDSALFPVIRFAVSENLSVRTSVACCVSFYLEFSFFFVQPTLLRDKSNLTIFLS